MHVSLDSRGGTLLRHNVVLCRGKRSGVYGAFLLAVYNQEAEEFQSISKIGTGFSEEQLKLFSEQLKELLVPSPKPYYRYPRPCASMTMERQSRNAWKAAAM